MPARGEATEGLLRSYFKDITATASVPLSRAREVELAARIQAGDAAARDELVQANLRFVVEVATHYQYRGLPLPDLISAGNVGLLRAAEGFDGTRGFKFISYAVWWIRQSIGETLAEQSHPVRLPGHKTALLREIAQVTADVGQEREEAPGAEELAGVLGVPVEQIIEVRRSILPLRSLDDVLQEGDERSLLDLLSDPDQAAPDAGVVHASSRALLERVLACLDARERFILARYLGLDGEPALTLAQIGARLGVSRERVRQLKEQALGRLRHPAHQHELTTLAEEA